jgi:serine O-acetyltransferase
MSSIHPSAHIGPGTVLGHHVVIEADVHIGPNCQIGHHVVLRSGTRLGASVRVDDGTSVGKQPMRAANSAVTTDEQLPGATIGDQCILGTNVVLYAGCVLAERVLVADGATVREHVTIGERTIVGRGVAIENKCSIGRRCKLETNAYITAYSVLEDFVFIAPGVRTSNDNFVGRTEERFKHFKGVTVRRGARIGVGAITLPGITIGEDALIAAGALVTRDAEPGMIHVGIPAKPVRPVPPEQRLDAQNW